MNPIRKSLRLALVAAALGAHAWSARAQDAGFAVPDDETADPPTEQRLHEAEALGAAGGWLSVAPALRSAAVRAYGQGRLPAADAWFHCYEWSVLFSEPEDVFNGQWMSAVQAAQVNYAGVVGDDTPSHEPIGRNLSADTQAWLLSNPAFSAEFFSDLTQEDRLPRVFAILESLRSPDPAKFARYSSLALAIAFVDDVPPPPYWPHGQVSPEALPRRLPDPVDQFDWLTRQDMQGRTYQRLSRLPAEELKFVVDAAAPIPELEWSQGAVGLPLDGFEGSYFMVKYRTDRSAAEAKMVWSGEPYTLQSILKEGGICVDQAYFAAEAGKARGVPTIMFMGSGHDGRHAWFGYLDPEGKWRLDAGRYAEQRLVTGVALDPQTWRAMSDHELQFLSERFRALPSYMESRVHEEFANDFLRQGAPGPAAHAARMAVNFERRNLLGWETLIAADQRLGLEPAKQEGVLREAALALARYPDLMIWYENRVCDSLRARGETSLAAFEERGIADREKGTRDDLAVQQASMILSRSIAGQRVQDQIGTYNAIIAQYGHGAGTAFFDQIVTGFAEHLAGMGLRGEARDAVERARIALEVQPGTQIATEMDNLVAKFQD